MILDASIIIYYIFTSRKQYFIDETPTFYYINRHRDLTPQSFKTACDIRTFGGHQSYILIL